VKAEWEALGRSIMIVTECWSEGAMRPRRRGTIQPVLRGYLNERLHWSWPVHVYPVLYEPAVGLVQVEE
jgi:hypothetical protein